MDFSGEFWQGVVSAAVVSFLIGFPIAMFFYRRGNPDPRPTYFSTGNSRVVHGSGEDITVLYSGKEVPRVSRTEVVFWNAGRGTIRADDVVEEHPVAFAFGGEILSKEIIAVSDDGCMLELVVAPDDNAVVVRFHHLNLGDGLVFEVLHTGDWAKDTTASGSISGWSGEFRRESSVPYPPQTRNELILWAWGSAALAVIVGALLGISAGWVEGALGVVVVLLVTALGASFSYWFFRWHRHPRLPGAAIPRPRPSDL